MSVSQRFVDYSVVNFVITTLQLTTGVDYSVLFLASAKLSVSAEYTYIQSNESKQSISMYECEDRLSVVVFFCNKKKGSSLELRLVFLLQLQFSQDVCMTIRTFSTISLFYSAILKFK